MEEFEVSLRPHVYGVALAGLLGCGPAAQVADPAMPPGPSDKASRTAAQNKIASPLLMAIDRARRHTASSRPSTLRIDASNRALVEIRADVTIPLKQKIDALGGTVVATAPAYRSTTAWVPLLALEHLAEEPAVQAIAPSSEPLHQSAPARGLR
jgi:hypothetical protein